MLDHLEAVRSLDLPEGSFIVVGASCLAVKGIRPSNDIDIVVTQAVFDLIRGRGWEIDPVFKEKWNRERLTHGHFEVYNDMVLEKEGKRFSAEELIPTAEMVEGVPFLSLPDLIRFKRDSARSKDLDDIVLTEDYLRTHP